MSKQGVLLINLDTLLTHKINDDELPTKMAPPEDNTVTVLKRLLSYGWEIFICLDVQKLDALLWISKYWGKDWMEKRTIITHDKTLVRADYFIDSSVQVNGLAKPVWYHIYFNPFSTDPLTLSSWNYDLCTRLLPSLHQNKKEIA